MNQASKLGSDIVSGLDHVIHDIGLAVPLAQTASRDTKSITSTAGSKSVPHKAAHKLVSAAPDANGTEEGKISMDEAIDNLLEEAEEDSTISDKVAYVVDKIGEGCKDGKIDCPSPEQQSVKKGV